MEEALEVKTERVDDIPLLLSQMEKMGIPEVIDETIKTHGHWRGISIGKVATVWLCYILSQGDHRKSQVEDWAAQRLSSLSSCLDEEVRALDFSDDRLSDILRLLSQEDTWAECEQRLNQRNLRVYNLQPKIIRIDTTTASSYGCVDDEGMLQFGHSKDHRPDLPQVKIASSTLDPLGMPVVTTVVSGEKADDPLYLPAVAMIQERLGARGLLYVGDSKMGALATRAGIAAGGDYYLCPLAKVQLPEAQLTGYLEAVHGQQQAAMRAVKREDAAGEEQVITAGFELVVECDFEQDDGSYFSWTERRLVVRSDAVAEAAEERLMKNLERGQAELAELTRRRRGKPLVRSVAELSNKADEIVTRYGVRGLLRVRVEEQKQHKQVRGYGGKPARTLVTSSFGVEVEVDQDALMKAVERLGWRVFVSNQDAALLPLEKAVGVYRNNYLHEHGYSRLKGRPLSLTPLYLQRDDQIIGLVHLLSIALRVLTAMEFVLRGSLAEHTEQLAGLYAGNPKRKTARPRTELLLAAFTNITLTTISMADEISYHLSELSPLQRSILEHSGFDDTVYTRLAKHSMHLAKL